MNLSRSNAKLVTHIAGTANGISFTVHQNISMFSMTASIPHCITSLINPSWRL